MTASVPPPCEASSPTTSSSCISSSIIGATQRTAPRILRIAVGSTNPSKIAAVQQAFGQAIGSSNTDDSNDNDDDSSPKLQLDIQGFDVDSGVPDQPFGDQETCEGGKNRAVAAFRAYKASTGNVPHFAVGMEGGLEWWSSLTSEDTASATTEDTTADNKDKDDEKKNRLLFCMAWMCVYGRRQAFTVDALASEDTAKYFGDKKPIFGIAKTASFVLPTPVVSLVTEKGMELGDADDQVFGRVNGKHGSGTVGILSKGLINRSAYYEHALLLALVPWFRPDVYPNGTN
jgi:non-canonical (house-cleaning) NTP pyrophosphatase